ncbi:unnamed protein product [Rotaria magnacalcarata]|uniref:Uncharacterized protein n=1 Tax=Rotaria magnacalcarata TaxID=392030 RepID=A0A816YN73_9BILA|nr:unnamed protein product [Rotaria magnacalcarata]
MGSGSSKAKTNKHTQFPSAKSWPSEDVRTKRKATQIPAKVEPVLQHVQTETIDIASFTEIVEEVDFSSIIDAEIRLDPTTASVSTGGSLSTANLRQKEPHEEDWKKKYFVHGDSSNIVAEVQNRVDGCVCSSVSEDINTYISSLHQISTQSDEILKERLSMMTSLEALTINKLVQQRQTLIEQIVKKGADEMKKSEEHYQKVIEEFITKLEVEMSKHLDELQGRMEDEKATVFESSHNSLQLLAVHVQAAKAKLLRSIEHSTSSKREEILKKIVQISSDTKRQPIGYEQLRKLTMEVYSTVGTIEDGQGSDKITDRNKFKKLIHDNQSPQQTKRTVYLEKDSSAPSGHRQ